MNVDGGLKRTWKDGKAKLNAYIEDHANVADALIVLYQVTGDVPYLQAAARLADVMITEFWDEENGGFYFTSSDHEELIIRNKDLFDNATPSGNSVAADVLLRLARLLGDERYERFGVSVLRIASNQLQRHPQGFGRMLAALEFHLSAKREIVVLGERGNELTRNVLSRYLPDTVIVRSGDPVKDAKVVPLLVGREKLGSALAAFVCENSVCQRPVDSVDELDKLIV